MNTAIYRFDNKEYKKVDTKTIVVIIILCIIVLAILTVIGLVFCLITDWIDRKRIDRYMSFYGFKKEIDHIYHLNKGEKYFFKFTRQYYDDNGNIALEEFKADTLYKMGYKKVLKAHIFIPKGLVKW